MPDAWLDDAIERGRATRLERPIPGRERHQLVRIAEDHYELRSQDQLVASRQEESVRRIGAALDALQKGVDSETLRERFDAAYVVAPDDIVTVALRAGASVRNGGDAWREDATEDLVRVSEFQGVLLANVPARSVWTRLPHAALRKRLLDEATIALRDALSPPTELLDPIPTATFGRAARIAALWRSHGFRAIQGVSQRTLRAAIRGEPDALEEVTRSVVESEDVPAITSLDEARARLADLERFAQTVYALELLVERADRGHSWRGFLSELAGVRAARPRPWQEGEALANNVRNRLGLDEQPVYGVKQLVMNRAGVLVQAGEELEGLEALGVASGRVPPCVQFVAPAARERPGLARFALAHQLCHFIVDRQARSQSSWACSQGGQPAEQVSAQEKRARAFAVYFLAPREAVREVAGEPIAPTRRADLIERAMRVRDRFGLTAVTSAEHLLNCWSSDAEARTTPLNDSLRSDLRTAGSQSELGDEFDADCPNEADPRIPGSGKLRRGVFSELVRTAFRTGQISEQKATNLLGSNAARGWLVAPD